MSGQLSTGSRGQACSSRIWQVRVERSTSWSTLHRTSSRCLQDSERHRSAWPGFLSREKLKLKLNEEPHTPALTCSANQQAYQVEISAAGRPTARRPTGRAQRKLTFFKHN